MTDDRLPEVWDRAQAEHPAEVGWEPGDWPAVLSRRRRRQLAAVTGLVVLVGVVSPVLRITVVERPPSVTYWLWAFLTLVYVAQTAYSRISPEGRAQWDRDTRQDVRIWHALRHHVGIGATDRALVTERAQQIDTWSKVAFVGWPLLAVILAAGILEGREPSSVLIVLVVLTCLLVARAARRARLARRWLADPLPREATAS